MRIDADFGKEVSTLIDRLGLSLRDVMLQTGIDHTTVRNMKKGLVPRLGVVIDFAQGLRQNTNYWLMGS